MACSMDSKWDLSWDRKKVDEMACEMARKLVYPKVALMGCSMDLQMVEMSAYLMVGLTEKWLE